ncbi:MAG: helix-turn-helix transcriptional regulator, partial [Thermoflexales bacterium]
NKICAHAEALMRRGEIAELRAWCEAAPPALRRLAPDLSMWLAWALVLGATPQQAEPHVSAAETRLARIERSPPPNSQGPNFASIRSQLALIRAIAARRAGKPGVAERWLNQARQIVPANDAVLTGVVEAQFSLLARDRGALSDAKGRMRTAAMRGESTRHGLLHVTSLDGLAALSLREGDSAGAEDLAWRAQTLAQTQGTGLNDFLTDDTRALATEAPIGALSPREKDVLACLRRGWRDPQIAQGLGISVTTVRWHCRNLYRKLGVNSRMAAVARR